MSASRIARESLPTQGSDVPSRSTEFPLSDQKDTGAARVGCCHCLMWKRRTSVYGTCYQHQSPSGFFRETLDDSACDSFTRKAVIVGR